MNKKLIQEEIAKLEKGSAGRNVTAWVLICTLILSPFGLLMLFMGWLRGRRIRKLKDMLLMGD